MTYRKLSITSSYHSQSPSPRKVMGTKAMEAFGLSDIYYSLYPLGANVLMIDIWSHHPGGILYWGTSWMVKPEGLLGWQINIWMPWPPCLYIAVCDSLGNSSLAFLNCHGVGRKLGWFANPCTHSSE